MAQELVRHLYPEATYGFCGDKETSGHFNIEIMQKTVYKSTTHEDKLVDDIHVVANKMKRIVEPHIYKKW